jgi:hypothetical protein
MVMMNSVSCSGQSSVKARVMSEEHSVTFSRVILLASRGWTKGVPDVAVAGSSSAGSHYGINARTVH